MTRPLGRQPFHDHGRHRPVEPVLLAQIHDQVAAGVPFRAEHGLDRARSPISGLERAAARPAPKETGDLQVAQLDDDVRVTGPALELKAVGQRLDQRHVGRGLLVPALLIGHRVLGWWSEGHSCSASMVPGRRHPVQPAGRRGAPNLTIRTPSRHQGTSRAVFPLPPREVGTGAT
jgi:hypothetical protein